MLSGSGFRDQSCLSHFFCKQCLSKHIIDLMSARMVEILSFQIYFCSPKSFRHLLCIIQSGRSACIFVEKFCEFPVKFRIIFVILICCFQFDHCIHQCFRDILPAMSTKTSFLIRHNFRSFLTAVIIAAIFLLSFRPSVSIPELTSIA